MRLRQGFRYGWLALLAAAADRVTKALASRMDGARSLIPGILRLRPMENEGMAFSMLSGQTALLTILSAVLIAVLVGWLIAHPDENRLLRSGLWLVVGGGIGNLFDRLAYGHVIDFIEPVFVRFAVFNVADACICVGEALALLGMLADEWRRKRESAHGDV